MVNPNLQPTNQFANLTEEELRQAFIDASNGLRGGANHFFDQFKYKYDLFSGNPAATLIQGLDLLNRCQAIDQAAFANIHKGGPYYWLGIAAFLVNEYELATFFFDASMAEDIRAGAHPINHPTPSFHFMLVDGEAPAQAARQLVQRVQARIQELIDTYNARPGRPAGATPLLIAELRGRFLVPAISPGGEHLRSSATALLSFSMEWDFLNSLFDIRPVLGTAEPFFLHLFKGCVLFESILKGNPTKPPVLNANLGGVLQHLYVELGISANINIGNTDFPTILNDLVGADDSIQTSIAFTGRIRNTLGHNLGWVVALNKDQYYKLFRMISSSCFHAIVCLFP